MSHKAQRLYKSWNIHILYNKTKPKFTNENLKPVAIYNILYHNKNNNSSKLKSRFDNLSFILLFYMIFLYFPFSSQPPYLYLRKKGIEKEKKDRNP